MWTHNSFSGKDFRFSTRASIPSRNYCGVDVHKNSEQKWMQTLKKPEKNAIDFEVWNVQRGKLCQFSWGFENSFCRVNRHFSYVCCRFTFSLYSKLLQASATV